VSTGLSPTPPPAFRRPHGARGLGLQPAHRGHPACAAFWPGPNIPPAIRWTLFLFLLTAFCGSCAHRYQKHQTAARTEETAHVWQTAETAASQMQSVATEKKQGNRQIRRWTPDGKLMEEVIEHWGSDGRVQVASSASASASATGQVSKSVAASSSSSTKADTRAGWSPWWWTLLLVPLALVAWALRRRIRAFIPWMG
jgi:hypothetical protein